CRARPALGHVGRHLVAALFQKREELLKLAGVGGMRRDFEPIGVFTVTIKLLPLASTVWCGLRSDVRLEFDVNAAALRVVQRPSLSQVGEILFCR
ncbi:MAG: hypothetical protein WBW59_01645, partial [Pseudolabrys sp.]